MLQKRILRYASHFMVSFLRFLAEQRKMPGFPTHIVGTPPIRGKARRYEDRANVLRAYGASLLRSAGMGSFVAGPLRRLPSWWQAST